MIDILPVAPSSTTDQMSPIRAADPTDVPQPQAAVIARRSYAVPLTTNTNADQTAAGWHLTVRSVAVHEAPDGTFTISGTVTNPMGQPIGADLIVTVTDHGNEFGATNETNAGCVPAGGSMPISWTGVTASSGTGDSAFHTYDDVQVRDSASVPGCGPAPGH